jgi:hypothetical protein
VWLIARRLRDNDGETSRFYLQFDGQLARQVHQHGRYIGKMLRGVMALGEHHCATDPWRNGARRAPLRHASISNISNFWSCNVVRMSLEFPKYWPRLMPNCHRNCKTRGCKLGQIVSMDPNVINPCVKSMHITGAKTRMHAGGVAQF